MIPSITVLAVDGKRLQTAAGSEPTSSEESEALFQQTPASSLVITVRANPQESNAIIKAVHTGSVHVVIRSAGDDLPWAN